jgi:hypothetical protein
MHSEGLVVLEKSPGVGASVGADWFVDFSIDSGSCPGLHLACWNHFSEVIKDSLTVVAGLHRPRRSPSPSVQRSSNSPSQRSGWCLGLDEMDKSSKAVVLVASQGATPVMD